MPTSYASSARPGRTRGHGSGTGALWHDLKIRHGTEHDSLRIVFDREGRMVRVVEWLDSGDEEEES